MVLDQPALIKKHHNMIFSKSSFFTFISLVFLSAVFLSACAPISSSPDISDDMAFEEARYQQRLVVAEYEEDLDRLMPISHQIMTKNADICYEDEDQKTYASGIYFDAADFLLLQGRPVGRVNTSNTAKAQPKIIYITPTSPADRHLKVGDILTHINGDLLDEKSISANLTKAGKVYTEFEKNGGGDLSLTVLRDGQSLTKTIRPVVTCPYNTYLSASANKSTQTINAYADGKNIVLLSSILDLAETDDRIALIVGHEMAHNTMYHVQKKQGNALLGNVLGTAIGVFTGVNMGGLLGQVGANAHSQGFESEADYFGVYYAARAGYNIDGVEDLWRRMAIKNPGSIHLVGSTHPSSAKRFLAIQETAKEITMKKQQGLTLEPNLSRKAINVRPATEAAPVNN